MTFWPSALFAIMGLGLVAYALTAGADFGAGVLALLSAGRRAEARRAAIRDAIAPIWEANHVWLIFVIVVMFSAFPRAFAVVSIAFHVPLALALVCIVLRGSAFVFRAYGIQSASTRRLWERVFSFSSIGGPLCLGAVLGGLASGDVRVVDHEVTTGFFAGWTTPFAWLTGCLSVALFTMLAATYMAATVRGGSRGRGQGGARSATSALQEDFRGNAIACEAVAGVLALLVLVRARVDAPELYATITGPLGVPLQGATAACAVATVALLLRRRFRLARVTAAAQVSLVVIGYGLAMNGHFVVPDVLVEDAVTYPPALPVLAVALGSGALVLGPALVYLYRVFAARPS